MVALLALSAAAAAAAAAALALLPPRPSFDAGHVFALAATSVLPERAAALLLPLLLLLLLLLTCTPAFDVRLPLSSSR